MVNLVECPVEFPPGISRFGTFANAFRIVPEAGQECFLDFCIYSSQEERAEVVARVRIHRSFLLVIQERLESVLTELTGDDTLFVVREGHIESLEGGVIPFQGGKGDA